MEGSGYSMLVGGYKQSEGEEVVKAGANTSHSTSERQKWATI